MSTNNRVTEEDYDSPHKIISSALADLVAEECDEKKLGVHVEITSELDPEWFLSRLDDLTEYTTGVILAGVTGPSISELQSEAEGTQIRVTDDVSHGVAWRNNEQTEFDWDGEISPERIVALIRGDPAKFGSLEKLSPVSGGQIRSKIAERMRQIPPFDSNVPGQRVWEAIEGPLGAQFDIHSVATYADSVTDGSGQTAIEKLGMELDELRLLPDEHLLDDPSEIGERLQSNRDLVSRVTNMSGTDERRLSRSINDAETEDERRERAKAVRKIRELHRGNRDILPDLEYQTVEDLMSTSVGGGGGGGTNRRGTSEYALESTFEGNEEDLKKKAEKFTRQFKRAVEDGENSVSAGLNDDDQLYDSSVADDDTYRFVTHFVDEDTYGGIVHDAEDVEDAVESFHSLETEHYNIASEDSRFQDLRRFAERRSEFETLVDALDDYHEARSQLVESVDELYSAPLLNLIADRALLDQADEYLEAYQKLESELESKYQTLNKQAGGSASSVLAEFLLLDSIAVRIENAEEEYQVILTPLHPLHLWKFANLARRVKEERDSLDENDKDFLRSAIERQPHVLRSLDIGSSERLPSAYLIQDKELANLPVYVPAEDASVGTNKEVWSHLISKFLTAHPHADKRLRISVVDPIRPGHLLDYLLQAAEDGKIGGCTVEFAYVERNRQSILEGSDDREEIIETFGPDSSDERFRIQVSEFNSYEDYLQDAEEKPKHLILANDHSTPTVREFERNQNVTVHPLYVPKIFDYNAFDDRIEMRSSPEGGIFSNHQNLVNNLNTRYNDVHSASVHRLQFDDTDVEEFLQKGVWTTISAPATNLDAFPQSNLIAEEHRGERDYGIYTKDRDYFNRALARLFNEYPLDVGEEEIGDLVDSIVEYERSGLLRLVTEETESRQLSRNAKGIIGSILAVKWLEREFEGPKLILSVDDPVTRKWLNLGDASERADFIVVRFDGDEYVTLEIVEVKALDDPDAEFSVDTTTSPPTISGEAIDEQLLPTTETIRSLFTEDADITTAPRQAALKEQIFYELMSSGVEGSKEEWVDRINATFSGDYDPEVTPNIVSVEITNGNHSPDSFSAISYTTSQDVDVSRLPRPVLYELITGELPKIDEESEDEAVEDEDTDASATDQQDASESSSQTSDEEIEQDSTVEDMVTSGEVKSPLSFGESEDYREVVEQLKLVLGDFGVSVRDIDPDIVDVGPNIIRYKVELGPSEKQSAIESRTEDIARQMAFEHEPIVHRLPGTEYIAIDVPRSKRVAVRLEECKDQLSDPTDVPVADLPFLAGVTPEGSVFKADVSSAPHMLVGGSTGSGKTVFLYSLITSVLEQKRPEDVDLALLDPKETDFLYFDSLPNLVNDGVIADAAEAQEFFDWVVNEEIPRRKELLKEKVTRDIGEYNELISDDEEPMRPLLVVIDEYADLLQQLGSEAEEVESDVRRIAQVARSLGIHLVIATQRPSHNAIDTDLRANLDMRVAFRLPKKSDSRILIDQGGAEELVGNGDMLFKHGEQITRLQGLLVESEDLREFVKSYR